MTHFIFIGNIIGIHIKIITYNSYPTMQGNSRTENRTNMKQPILSYIIIFISQYSYSRVCCPKYNFV